MYKHWPFRGSCYGLSECTLTGAAKMEAPQYIFIESAVFVVYCSSCWSFESVLFVGENSIVIVSGANDILSEEDIKKAKSVISSSSVCVCQLEINPEVTHYTLSLAKKAGGEYCRKCNVQISYFTQWYLFYPIQGRGWGAGGRGIALNTPSHLMLWKWG